MSYYDSEEIYDLELENLKLKQKLEKTIKALKWIADCKPIIKCVYPNIIRKTREALKETEK